MMGKLALAGSTVIVANTELTPNNGTIGSKPGQTHVPDCAILSTQILFLNSLRRVRTIGVR
jgi:hypothetical protein